MKREKLACLSPGDGRQAGGADEAFANADSVIPGAGVLDGVFKERMFAPVNI